MDLLTYLQNYENYDLKQVSNGTYTTKTHDSLRISNGLWNWFSRGIGGRTAVDYIKARENLNFIGAVKYILERTGTHRTFVFDDENFKKYEEKNVIIPQKNESCKRAKSYLLSRGIDEEIIEECIKNHLIYEEKGNENVVFVGYDKNKNIRYAFCRATNENKIMREAKGSDKKYTFRLDSVKKNNRVHFFESSIDLLSYATLMKMKNLDFHNENLISLGGIFIPQTNDGVAKIPIPITNFLKENSNINEIHLHLDNDEVGRNASKVLKNILSKKYKVLDSPPPAGKDCNDYLCYVKKIKNFTKNTNEMVAQRERAR